MPGPGAELSGRFYRQLVAPLVERHFPGLAYAAGRLGTGSDVLGLDDQRSQDHDFGCRLHLLLDDSDSGLVGPLRQVLDKELPESFEGWPVHFPLSPSALADNLQVASVRDFALSHLGVDPTRPMEVADWLCLSGQSVLEVVAGSLFHAGSAQLSELRRSLAWYPEDLWMYVLSAGWARLGQELPFVGRAGERGDEAGSAVIAARLVRDLMHLWFLVQRRWAPYPKWSGSALKALPGGAAFAAQLEAALGASRWDGRQGALAAAIEMLARQQEEVGLPSADPAVVPFFGRPFLTPDGAIHQALREAVSDPLVRRLPDGVGSVEQWSDNVDVLSHPTRRMALRSVYRGWSNPD